MAKHGTDCHPGRDTKGHCDQIERRRPEIYRIPGNFIHDPEVNKSKCQRIPRIFQEVHSCEQDSAEKAGKTETQGKLDQPLQSDTAAKREMLLLDSYSMFFAHRRDAQKNGAK